MKPKLSLLASALALICACNSNINITGTVDSLPEIFPDYAGVTVPVNIAPLNFKYDAPAEASVATLESSTGQVRIKGPEFDIPMNKWKTLTKGGDITVTVYVKESGEWKAFLPFTIHVSPDEIDSYVAYRLIPPGYETWYRMGLYQRCLETFDQTPIITNDKTGDNCMNCHSFCNRDPDRMMFHMRAVNGGTYTWINGSMEKLNTKTPRTMSALVYPRWHPSGKFIAFSVNDIAQFFHTTNPNRIEVYDYKSDLVMYDVERHEVFSTPLLMDTTRFETFPAFSADGRTLYFCSTPAQVMPEGYKSIRYSICSIAFDPDKMTFGDKVDTLYSARSTGKGATFPRISPDGRFLLFTETAYGCFAIWHHDADLRILDLKNGGMHTLDEANSNDAESYHCWSSNGRWIIYTSRRLDGLYSRLYISHIDAEGHASKAFLLPQRKTDFYTSLMYSYNVPEFITDKVDFDSAKMAEFAMNDPGKDVSFRE